MMNQITQILNLTESEYEIHKFSSYLNWCDEHSSNINHLQALLSHQKIYNWFSKEHKELEKTFLEAASNYNTSDYRSLRRVYNDFTSKIGYYPKALLKNLKVKIPKSNIINHNNN